MSTEADARMLIDRLLEQAGWCITNKAQVSTEEAAADGRADYLLKDTRSRPLAVLEAKRFAVDPYSAKEQAKAYALTLKAPFVILSNGQEHYFWDYTDGDARPVMGVPSQADLERRANIKVHRKGDIRQSLSLQPLPHRFDFKGEEVEARPYQLECLQKADDALIAGRRRMLFEMATGTGKTLTIAMLMKRWLQTAIISRVLFLVDRIELAKQAKETFDEYLRDWPTVILYGGKRSLEGQIVVGTLDTIATQLGGNGFGHGYFDLVVTDECHRSIYNTHRATLGHFDAIHVDLTARWWLTQACLPLLSGSDAGAVVFAIDDPVRVGGTGAFWGGYGLAQAAQAALVPMLQAELGADGPRISGLRPGPMRTGLRARAFQPNTDFKARAPETYAAACVELLSSAAADARGRVVEID